MNEIDKEWLKINKSLIKNKCPVDLISFIRVTYYQGVIAGINNSIKIVKNTKGVSDYRLKMAGLIVECLNNLKGSDIKKPTIINNGTVH